MNVVKRIGIAAYGLIFFVLIAIGAGLGVTIWLRSWHGSFTQAASASGALQNTALPAMLNDLSSKATAMTIVIAVIAAAALAFGITSVVVLRRSLERQVNGALGDLSGSAMQLRAIASQVAAATAQTAGATGETTATVEEVRQTALLAQEKAEETLELAQQVLMGFTYGAQSARQNLAKFTEIRDDMELAVDAIDQLKERAGSVRDIIASVNDLAEQSNLLSVNASIEAAKAGEQGKGFSVVAQEVKSLATQSKQAVRQVHGILGEIQKASAIAVDSTSRAREAVESGRAEAEQAVAATDTDLEVATKSTEATQQIAAAARQQLAGMEQISKAIASINEAGRQSVQGVRLVEQEVAGLQGVAQRLGALLDVAEMPDGRGGAITA